MFAKIVLSRLKSLILFVIGIFKRALCCFRRRRKASFEAIPLTNIGIVPNTMPSIAENEEPQLENWNSSWEDGPTAVVTDRSPDTVKEHIEMYRQRVSHKSISEEEEENVNFFEDMTPRITKQTKILLRNKDNDVSNSSRLAMSIDPVAYSSPELDVWEESPGWEDQTREEWDSDMILREKKMLERQRRLDEQRRKKQEKEGSKASKSHALGARLS